MMSDTENDGWKEESEPIMTDNIDTMTPAELSREIAEAMGLYTKVQHGCVYIHQGGISWVVFSPPTSWADWGMVYEWMRRGGWKRARVIIEDDVVQWEWRKRVRGIDRLFIEVDPDIRRAVVKAAIKAVRGEKGECHGGPWINGGEDDHGPVDICATCGKGREMHEEGKGE